MKATLKSIAGAIRCAMEDYEELNVLVCELIGVFGLLWWARAPILAGIQFYVFWRVVAWIFLANRRAYHAPRWETTLFGLLIYPINWMLWAVLTRIGHAPDQAELMASRRAWYTKAGYTPEDIEAFMQEDEQEAVPGVLAYAIDRLNRRLEAWNARADQEGA